jgi:hypothetical protein
MSDKKIKFKEIKAGDLLTIPSHNAKENIVVRAIDYGDSMYLDILNRVTKSIRQLHLNRSVEVIRHAKKASASKEYKKYCYDNTISNQQMLSADMGSDPEIFVLDANGKIIPSWEFLPSKEKPKKYQGYGGAATKQNMFWDGFQAEFNIEAGTCLDYRSDAIWSGLKAMITEARKYNKDAKLTIQSTMNVDKKLLKSAADEHVQFGCTPSLNAYGMEGLKLDGREVPFRSAGGHIHIGCKNYIKKEGTAERYVKALDKILGVACVSLFANFDDPRRRSMYGLAGEYRLPKHGLEYRTLSNAWLSHPVIYNMVFELCRKVIGLEQKDLMEFWIASEEDTVNAINQCDVKLARKILLKNEDMFKKILFSICHDDKKTLAMFNTFMLGMESLIANPDDIVGNWQLDASKRVTARMNLNRDTGQVAQIRFMEHMKTYNAVNKKIDFTKLRVVRVKKAA